MSAVRDMTASRALTGAAIRDTGNTLRTIAGINIRDADGLHSVLSASTGLTVNPQYLSGAGYSKASISVTTDTTSITAPAGATFAWTFPDTGWTASNPTGGSTSFSHRCAPGSDYLTNANCAVTINGHIYNVTVGCEVMNTYGGLE